MLSHERNERAKLFGKSVEETPWAEGLTVRVVSSVEKKLETKPHFYRAFKEQGYPAEFNYRSKAGAYTRSQFSSARALPPTTPT